MVPRYFVAGRHLSTAICSARQAFFSSLPASNDFHQRGYGKIVATSSSKIGSSSISTNLTELSHSSPMRLVPSRRSHPNPNKSGVNYEAAIVHLSSYGGGYVPGDMIDLDIDVRGDGAVVYVLTQGGTRIYRPGDEFRKHNNYMHKNNGQRDDKSANTMAKLCQSTITCTVDPGATLIFLPDPTVPYYQTAFEEQRLFNCKYSKDVMGSIIAVDWYGSGRRHSTGMEDEKWSFDYLSTRTELCVDHQQLKGSNQPIMIESMTLDNTKSSGRSSLSPAAISLGKQNDSYATILLHGPNSFEVATRATILSCHLASLETRVRRGEFGETNNSAGEESDLVRLSGALGGKVLLSVSPIEAEDSSETQTHLVRILAKSNEDIYRILHFCLRPCAHLLGGIEPYKDRIHSSGTLRSPSARAAQVSSQTKTAVADRQSKMIESDLRKITNNLVFGKDCMDKPKDLTTDAWFHTCLFSDSALPVGSFAHSLGTEAASQLGLFTECGHAQSCSEDDLADYIYALSRSNARFSTPIILGAYSLVANGLYIDGVEQTLKSWLEIDSWTDKLLKSNGPGRRASMDQGLGFLRIAPALLKKNDRDAAHNLLEHIKVCIHDKNDAYLQPLSLDTFQSLQYAKGHAAPLYGVLAGSLGFDPLDACRVFAFGAARDSVSAAVRLNLIGPVAGLSLLNDVGRDAVAEGLEEGLLAMSDRTSAEDSVSERCRHGLRSASMCAPLMDVVHPCHDLLSVRLFRT